MLTPTFSMNQTCEIRRWLRRGISADEYEAPETVRCRANLGRRRVKSSTAEEITTDGALYLPAGTRVTAKDRVAFDGAEYRVIACQPRYDFAGRENHVEVTFGR